MNLIEKIETVIRNHIPDAMILVMDPHNDGEHFEAVVISDSFDELSLLKQHQAIMKPLRSEFDDRLHALALKTFSLKKWNEVKKNHPKIEEKIKEKYQ